MSGPTTSLKTRLGWGLFISLTLLFTLLFLGINLVFQDILETQVSTRLDHDAESVLNALIIDKPGIRLDPARTDPIFARPFSGYYFVVVSGATRLRSRSLWDQDLVLDPNADHNGTMRVTGPQGQRLLVLFKSYKKSGRVVNVAVGEDMSHLEKALDTARWRYGIAVLAALLLMVWAQRRLVASTLRPLEGVREDVAALERGDVATLRETVPREVRPLVAEFNRLLELMHSRVGRSRNALGNLAHALKTPLTLITQMGDSPEIVAHPELKARLDRETASIGRLMERELSRARMVGFAAPGQWLDLSEELATLADTMKVVYRDKRLTLSVDILPHTRFAGDREDVLELFGNLMENACKWATSRVRVWHHPCDGEDVLELRVADDGPGVAEDVLSTLTRRGARADESAPGHGLGLAIAREVAESYGGSLELGRCAELGGFMVRVRLPDRSKWAADN